jgi:carbamate kinase
MTAKKNWAVIAVGGNALIKDPQHKTVPDQYRAAKETMHHIADMIEQGWEIAIGHGNGPQVGFILRRSEVAEKVAGMHPVPLDACGADSQGAIGYAFQQNLYNEFKRRGMKKNVATVVTQVLVDRDDPGFQNPSKGIGGFTTEDKARAFEIDGWRVVEDAGRGWRRVIASPIPLRIVELDAIRKLVEDGFIVIAVGGGGIPVIEDEDGYLVGTRAVIDKDRATSLLAQELKVDLFLISTAVPQVAINYNKPNQQWLGQMTAAEARAYYNEGHFAPGSMGPKVEAVLSFLDAHPEGKALITDPPNIARALDGETGTWIEA